MYISLSFFFLIWALLAAGVVGNRRHKDFGPGWIWLIAMCVTSLAGLPWFVDTLLDFVYKILTNPSPGAVTSLGVFCLSLALWVALAYFLHRMIAES
jgi:hypothetical protein